MTTRRLRNLLYLGAICLVGAALGVVVWGVFVTPSNQQGAGDHTREVVTDPMDDALLAPVLPPRESLLAITQHPLRQQLFDPPPPAPEPDPPPPPLPGIELISTVLPSNAAPSAWVREVASGNTPRRVRVGDVLGPADNPATLIAIEPGRLLVEHHGEIKPIERSSTNAGGRR